MNLLIIGVSLFVLVHLLPSVVPLRATLFEKLGEGPYKGIYSLLALTGLGLMIYGKAVADFVPVYSPPGWTRQVSWVVMLPALIMITGANVPGNIKRFTPHPMMWAVFLWSATHLASNGDQASIILFAPLGVFALIHIVTANARGAALQTEVLPAKADFKVIAIGIVSYAIFAGLHPYIFKVSAFF